MVIYDTKSLLYWPPATRLFAVFRVASSWLSWSSWSSWLSWSSLSSSSTSSRVVWRQSWRKCWTLKIDSNSTWKKLLRSSFRTVRMIGSGFESRTINNFRLSTRPSYVDHSHSYLKDQFVISSKEKSQMLLLSRFYSVNWCHSKACCCFYTWTSRAGLRKLSPANISSAWTRINQT